MPCTHSFTNASHNGMNVTSLTGHGENAFLLIVTRIFVRKCLHQCFDLFFPLFFPPVPFFLFSLNSRECLSIVADEIKVAKCQNVRKYRVVMNIVWVETIRGCKRNLAAGRRKVKWKVRDANCAEELFLVATIAEPRWFEDKIWSTRSLTGIGYEASKKAEFTFVR